MILSPGHLIFYYYFMTQLWPVDGGMDLSGQSSQSRNLLITGHEDGSVKVGYYITHFLKSQVCNCVEIVSFLSLRFNHDFALFVFFV